MTRSDPEIRTLHATEREALLELLDGWPLRDGWRGRDFFRRYLELDPDYEDDNVWVAAEGGRLVSCVQIFPRRIRSTAGEIPCGGIGSVFTAPSHRERGLAARLLAEAATAMRACGMEVSILVAGRLSWYSGLGWRVWGPPQYLLRSIRVHRGGSSSKAAGAFPRDSGARDSLAAGIELAEVDPLRDAKLSEELWVLAERAAAGVFGSVARGPVGWAASLSLAGNPRESFQVARAKGRVVAFVRSCRLDGKPQVTEWAFEPGAEAFVAELLIRARPPRGALSLPPVSDPALLRELERRGFELEPSRGAAWMLRCLDPEALARRLGLTPADPARGDEEALLERLFPRSRFGFWTADRF